MSTDHAEHDQTRGMAKQKPHIPFFLSLLLVAAEVGGGLLAHSLALLSEAEGPANACKTLAIEECCDD